MMEMIFFHSRKESENEITSGMEGYYERHLRAP